MRASLKARFGCLLVVALGMTANVHAQANFSFTYRSAPTSGLVAINPNGQIEAAATAVGSTSTVTLIVANNTNSTWNLGDVTVTGSGFKLVSGGNAPIASGLT